MSDEISGIYEQQNVSWAPSILVRGNATASVVSRYWGEPPANTGVQYEGGDWFPFLDRLGGSSCAGLIDRKGNVLTPDGPVGTLGYGVVYRPHSVKAPVSPEEAADRGTVVWHRSAPELPLANGGNTGDLSAAEVDLLEDTFGSPVLVDITTMTRLRATLLVWWPVALFGILVFVVGRSIWRRVRRRRSRLAVEP